MRAEQGNRGWVAIGQGWQRRSAGMKQGFGFSGGGERGEQREPAGEFVASIVGVSGEEG